MRIDHIIDVSIVLLDYRPLTSAYLYHILAYFAMLFSHAIAYTLIISTVP